MTDIDPFEALPNGRQPLSEDRPTARGGRRLLLGAVLAIAIFGGFSAIAWVAYNRGFYSGSDEVAPLVRADDGPTRRRPADPGGLDIPDQDKLVFERLSPGQSEAGVERLLPAPEQPLPLPDPAPVEPPAAVAQGQDEAPPPPPPLPEQNIAVVTQPLPDAPPQVPAPPPATLPASDGDLDLEEVIAAVSDDPPVAPAPDAADPPPAAVATAEPAPDTPADQPEVAAAPPVPEPAPEPEATVESLPLPETSETVAVVPAEGTDPPPASAPAAAGDGWRIQLAAVRDESGAAAEWQRLQGKHPQLLGPLALSVQRADLDAGTFYRIQAGPLADQAAARQRCADLNTAGQDCLVVRP